MDLSQSLTSHDRAAEENDEHFKVLIPAVVFSVIAMTIGFFGNILVLYIFKFRYKPSNHRYFIISLAAFDLLFDFFGIPFMIVEMRLSYIFTNEAACKVYRFINYSYGCGSGLIVTTIAVDRYLKVCKSNGTQINSKMAKVLCFLLAFIGILVALPSVELYGQYKVQKKQNITVIQCLPQNKYEENPLFPTLYNGFLALCFTGSVVTICICYTLIVRRVASQTSVVKPHRVAKMLLVVTAVFVVSYIPYFSLIITVYANKNYKEDWSKTGEAFFEVFWRSFLINGFANPIIYGFMDKNFRVECKTLLYRFINRG